MHVPDRPHARAWIADFCSTFDSVTLGAGTEPGLAPELPAVEPDLAPLGLSIAKALIAETGSLVLDARDGRRSQLLAPTHVVVVRATTAHATIRDALESMKGDLPSALGLHSGPSKSADIGQVMVNGVHGPGRLIALVIRDEDD